MSWLNLYMYVCCVIGKPHICIHYYAVASVLLRMHSASLRDLIISNQVLLCVCVCVWNVQKDGWVLCGGLLLKHQKHTIPPTSNSSTVNNNKHNIYCNCMDRRSTVYVIKLCITWMHEHLFIFKRSKQMKCTILVRWFCLVWQCSQTRLPPKSRIYNLWLQEKIRRRRRCVVCVVFGFYGYYRYV